MQQLSKMGPPTPLNLRPPLSGESERVHGDEEELEAGERGARELEEHVLQRLACLEEFEITMMPLEIYCFAYFERLGQNYD